jgi:hypothetical protein
LLSGPARCDFFRTAEPSISFEPDVREALMKIRYALVVGTSLVFAACVATADWTPAHAAQPDGPKKPKTAVKHKKPAPRNTQNPGKPSGEPSRPEVQRGY